MYEPWADMNLKLFASIDPHHDAVILKLYWGFKSLMQLTNRPKWKFINVLKRKLDMDNIFINLLKKFEKEFEVEKQ